MTIQGKILRNTSISGEPVAAGEVVEVDEATFRILHQIGKIERVRPEGEAPKEPNKAAPKFKKIAPAAPK